MSKTLVIIQREYLTRVRKKSFVIMTIIGPILMASLLIVPAFIANMSDGIYKVAVVDDTNLFYEQFRDANSIEFTRLETDIDSALEIMHADAFDAVLHIPSTAFHAPSTLRIFSDESVNFNAKIYMENILQDEFKSMKLAHAGIDPEILRSTETRISIQSVKISDDGAQQSDFPELSMGLGVFGGLLIYFFVFLFGSQVMRGVMEEKGNRIVEIIVSSVKPFQLMMGKIVGIAMVGLTQFLIWIVFTFFLVSVASLALPEYFSLTANPISANTTNEMSSGITQSFASDSNLKQLFEYLGNINYGVMIFSFVFYFLGGYLLYAALFAAIGSAVDNEADTQQFMLPITIPMIFSIIMAQVVMSNPSGPLAFWLSVIPFTSPIIMMVRIPFGVPWFDITLSMTLLILGFIFTTWLAAKIYRTGILMYGKKVSYRDLWKWIKLKK
ncbi:MAG: ABC transporter permease [Bacteroidales bacterium]